MSFEQKRRLEAEMQKLANDGISCTVEGETIVCTGEILKTEEEKIRIPASTFSADDVRRKFEEKERPAEEQPAQENV